MMVEYYAIKNNKIECKIMVSPFSKANMDKMCKDNKYDGWFEMDIEGACELMGVECPDMRENDKRRKE
jgi:hypothetical protein